MYNIQKVGENISGQLVTFAFNWFYVQVISTYKRTPVPIKKQNDSTFSSALFISSLQLSRTL